MNLAGTWFFWDEAAKMFSTSTAKTYTAPPNDKLMMETIKNVPWKIDTPICCRMTA